MIPWLGLALVVLMLALQAFLTSLAEGQGNALTRWLILVAARSPELLQGEGWHRLWTSALFHGSWPHLLLNAFGILTLAAFVEAALGRSATLVLLVLAAPLGGLASGLLTEQPAAGASTLLLALSGCSAGLALTRLRREGPASGGILHVAVFVGLELISMLRLGSMDSGGHLGAGLTGLAWGLLWAPRFRQTGARLWNCLGTLAGLLLLLALHQAAQTVAFPPAPPEDSLGGPSSPGPALPQAPFWTPGQYREDEGCLPLEAGLSPQAALARGQLLCFKDPYYNLLLVGPASVAQKQGLWKEAALRTMGRAPGQYPELALHFRVRPDGLVLGLAVFRPLEAAYLPLFLALASFESGLRFLDLKSEAR